MRGCHHQGICQLDFLLTGFGGDRKIELIVCLIISSSPIKYQQIRTNKSTKLSLIMKENWQLGFIHLTVEGFEVNLHNTVFNGKIAIKNPGKCNLTETVVSSILISNKHISGSPCYINIYIILHNNKTVSMLYIKKCQADKKKSAIKRYSTYALATLCACLAHDCYATRKLLQSIINSSLNFHRVSISHYFSINLQLKILTKTRVQLSYAVHLL